MKPVKLVLQVLATAAIMAIIGIFGNGPTYQFLDDDREAMIKLAISRVSDRSEACVQRTPEELAKLPPNMRVAQSCSRERVPVLIEVDINGETVFSGWRRPSGLSRDGAARFYEKFKISPGEHTIKVAMRDSLREDGFDHAFEQKVAIAPLEIVVIDYENEKRDFVLR